MTSLSPGHSFRSSSAGVLASRIEMFVARALSPTILVLAYVFLFAPLVVLIAYSFNAGRSTVVWSGFSFKWYEAVFADRNLGRAFWVSVMVAVVSASASTIVGTLAALALGRRRFLGAAFFSTLLTAPLVLPEIVMAVGLLVFMVATGLGLGYGSMIAGHILVTIPFTTLIVRAATAALDHRLDEAAADLGANDWQVFTRVTMPLLAPSIMTAFLLAATLSFDNFVMSTFTAGVGTTPLPIHIYSMLKLGITPQINALGTLMVAFNVAIILVVMTRYLALTFNKKPDH
ncbi:ABC transporter permease [Segnochrobactrum spirostomi]|nr:ABC transporter permease [Segnochrobactrum spirostomi]